MPYVTMTMTIPNESPEESKQAAEHSVQKMLADLGLKVDKESFIAYDDGLGSWVTRAAVDVSDQFEQQPKVDHHVDATDGLRYLTQRAIHRGAEADYWKRLALKLFENGVDRWHTECARHPKAHRYLGIKKREYDALLEATMPKTVRIDTAEDASGAVFSKEAVVRVNRAKYGAFEMGTDRIPQFKPGDSGYDWPTEGREGCPGSGRWVSEGSRPLNSPQPCPVCDAPVSTSLSYGADSRLYVVFSDHYEPGPAVLEHGSGEVERDWPTTRDEG